jgi:hypothetical protein
MKNMGPLDVSLIKTAIMTNKGAEIINPSVDRIIATILLISNILERFSIPFMRIDSNIIYRKAIVKVGSGG